MNEQAGYSPRFPGVIRDRLRGAWELVSFESKLPDGRVIAPLGRRATGSILYADNGCVGVNVARGGCQRKGGGGSV